MDNTQWIVFGIGIAVCIGGIVSIVMGFKTRQKLAVMKGIQTMTADAVCNMGDTTGTVKVEVAGITEADMPLTSPATNTPCLYYRHQVEQLEVDYDRDYDGDYQREEHWRTVADSKRDVPFTIRDSSGAVGVNPDGASFVSKQTMNGQYGAYGVDVYRQEKSDGIMGTVLDTISSLGGGATNSFRTSEWVIPLGQQVYVLGNAVRQGDQCIIGKGNGPFIVSVKSEEQLTKRYIWTAVGWFAFGAAASTGGVVAAIFAFTAMG